MSLLLTLKKIFTLGLFSNILGSSESSEVNQNVRGLLRDDMKSFAYFVMHSYYYLNITPLIEMSVYRSEDCGMSCLKHVSCLSYNVAAFRDLREQKTLCELLPSDKYNESNRFSPSQHYHHFSIMIPCSNKPCTNGARCVAKYEENDYQCFCVPGYTGRHCRTDIDECSSSPCLNSGSCSDHVNSYTCNCLAGFTGVNCETNINECSSQPCLNGGTCVDGINMFRCNCIQHTTGLTCATINVTSPIALYPLNAAYTSKDSTGNQPDGITSNVTLAVGPDGNSQGSYEFSGEVSSYVELPNNGGLDIMHSMTLVMWVYSEGTDGPLFNYRPRGNWATHFWVNGGQFFTRFVKRNDEFVAPLNSSVITTNRWYYVGTSYDYNTGLARLWVDGVEVHQLDVGIYTLGTVGNVRIGVKRDDNRYFKGRVAKVQVYNLTLTLEQVQAVKYRG